MLLSSQRDNQIILDCKALFCTGLCSFFEYNLIIPVDLAVANPPALVARSKNNSQLFLRLRRRPHSSQRDIRIVPNCKALFYTGLCSFFEYNLIIPVDLAVANPPALVARSKNNSQLFLRLRRRPHSSQRDIYFITACPKMDTL